MTDQLGFPSVMGGGGVVSLHTPVITLPRVENFVAKERFVVGGHDFSLIGRNGFFEFLYQDVIEKDVPSLTARSFRIHSRTNALELVGLSVGYRPFFLAHLWHLMTLQPQGQFGLLETADRKENYFLVSDDQGDQQLISACWWVARNGWYIDFHASVRGNTIDPDRRLFLGPHIAAT
jgi:hypothetical protein